MVEVISLSGTLSNSCKYRISAMLCGYVTDKLLNKNCLTNSGTTEKSNLTTLLVWTEKVYYFNTCLKNLSLCGLLLKSRCLSVNRHIFHALRCRLIVDSFTKDIKNSSKCLLTNRNTYRSACVDCLHSSYQTISRTHGYTSYCIITQML